MSPNRDHTAVSLDSIPLVSSAGMGSVVFSAVVTPIAGSADSVGAEMSRVSLLFIMSPPSDHERRRAAQPPFRWSPEGECVQRATAW